jgi:aspartyl/glutamyl-tRNA(Asn/Gln) amidotransferase C subunit
MTLTQEQIKKISKNLSKIPLESEEMEKDLNNILDYFKLLDEVDTSSTKPTYSVISKKNNLRPDILEDKKISRKELLECSNQQVVADQIAISNIMK